MAGTTSLLASAASTRASVDDYNDRIAAIEFANSGYTDDALAAYKKYLNGRINSLNAAGGISNANKSLSLSQDLQSAIKSNISATIRQANYQVLYGGASLQTKADVIRTQYSRAASIGDQTLMTQLAAQYASVNQSIQQQADEAEKAQESLMKANTSALKGGYTDAMDEVKAQMKDAVALIHSGTPATTALKSVNTNLNGLLKELTGEGIPKGTEVNLGSTLQAYFNAEFSYAQQASTALRASDPEAADQFAQYDADGNIIGGKAYSIMSNQSYLDIPGIGNVNAKDAANFAADPNLLGVRTDESGNLKFFRNTITGYNANGVPLADQTRALDMSKQTDSKDQMKQLEKLGFGDIKVNNDGSLTAKFTGKTDKWVGFGNKNSDFLSSSALGRGNEITLIPQANGTFQFLHNDHLYNIALDTKGLGGLFETLPTGKNVPLAGQYGFNNKINTLLQNASLDRLNIQEQEAKAEAANVALQTKLKAAKIPTASLYGTATSKSSNAAFLPAVTATKPKQKGPTMSQRSGGGFNFTNSSGQAISAATYAKLTNTSFRTLLQRMANAGDAGAKAALGFVGNDFGYDPRKVAAGSSNAKLYNALVWGTGRSAPVTGPTIKNGILTLPSGFQL